MSNYGSVAAAVRLAKERSPDQFCPVPRCLWRIKGHDGSPRKPCRNHPVAAPKVSP